MTTPQTGPESQIARPSPKGVENVDGSTSGQRTAPKCKRCGGQHWPFEPCAEDTESALREDKQQQSSAMNKPGPSLSDKFIPVCSLCGRRHWPLDPSCMGKKGVKSEAKAAEQARLRAEAEKKAAVESRLRAEADANWQLSSTAQPKHSQTLNPRRNCGSRPKIRSKVTLRN